VDRIDVIQRELIEEMASSLGRVAEKLEGFLARCAALAAADAADYEEARRQAELHLWYLVVQREAIGFRDHSRVYAMYPLPPRRRAPDAGGAR